HLLLAVPQLQLPARGNRRVPRLAVLRQPLLDQRSMAVSPARGLRALSLGSLLRRCPARGRLQIGRASCRERVQRVEEGGSSSRRRHTRFSRDWSSDVCSSDLHLLLAVPQLQLPARGNRRVPRLAVLRQPLLDQRSMAVSPARGLRALSLGSLLRRCPARGRL